MAPASEEAKPIDSQLTATPAADAEHSTSASPQNGISLRSPSSHTLATAKPISSPVKPPAPEWLTGTWHVTHSTLPMWKDKCNVKITYKPLSKAEDGRMPDIDDLVEYQTKPSTKKSSVHGVSRVAHVGGLPHGCAFNWRGKGWLVIASSKWEILGWGEDLGVGWVVTYFSKTIFTPAGIDVYCRDPNGLGQENMAKIGNALKALEEPSIAKLADELFFTRHTCF